jgi:hypothetical protein
MSIKTNMLGVGEKQFNVSFDDIRSASDQVLEKWAVDPQCNEKESCKKELIRRQQELVQQDLPAKESDRPFDPRTEVSADARHIANRVVANLWIIFVLMPSALGLLWLAVK